MPKVSISVPVYNVEQYLPHCLDSLLCQTLKDIEIIIVNDGSTDGSLQTCKKYARKDVRIKLINKENGGSSSARQVALDASTGEFICSCDADDWVESDMCERLYKKAVETRADIMMCDYWAEYPDGRQVAHAYGKDPNESRDLFDDALNGRFPSMVWNKIFKREVFTKHNLSWEKGINLGEDFLMTLKLLQHPVRVAYLPKPLYHYRRLYGGSSYTNNITMDTFRQSLFIRQWAMANIDNRKYANGLFRLWMQLGFTALRVKDGMTPQYYEQDVLKHIPYVGFIKYNYHKLKGMLVLSSKIFGYRFAKSIYKLLYKRFYR